MARKSIKRTSPPLFPEHSFEEHQWRLNRARKFMKEDNLDVLVLARNVNAFYMTGSRFVFVGMDAPMALSPQTAAVVTPETDIYSQRFGVFDNDEVGLHTAWGEHLEFYDDDAELVNILKDYGLRRGSRVGVEWGPGLCLGINPLKFLGLKSTLENGLGAQIVDATPTIWKMTAVKSKLEIERMRVAVKAAATAMQRVYDAIEIGMIETEVSRMASLYMLEAGADKLSHAQVMAIGEGLAFNSCDAVDRRIEKGFVHLDIGAKYRRYGSDINRGIFLGRKPTSDEEKLYECRKGMNEVMEKTIKPGVCVDDVLSRMKQYATSQGCHLMDFGGHPFGGHGIGLENYQQPGIMPSSLQPTFQDKNGKFLFEEGMMFTFEMGVEIPGKKLPFFNVEDDVVVSATGIENMCSTLSRELRVKL
jgi:Xaa-Pro aminopeptidase